MMVIPKGWCMLTGFDTNYPRIILICIKGSGNFIGTGLISNTFQQSVSIICRNKSKGGRENTRTTSPCFGNLLETNKVNLWWIAHLAQLRCWTKDAPPQIRMSLWGSLCWSLSAWSASLTLQHGPDTSGTAFPCASGTSTPWKAEERCLGGNVGALQSQHWRKGEWKKEPRKPLIMCNVNSSVTHQRLCHSN